ncbi:MAG: pilin [Patescibacteria group bacterium]|nr:pilin [Patescibacteria group bacterium]
MNKLFALGSAASAVAISGVSQAYAGFSDDPSTNQTKLFGSSVQNITESESASGYSLLTYIGNTINFFLSLVGIVAVLYIVYAGFQYITGADPEEAKKKITNAVIGLVVVIIAYSIVSYVTGANSFLYSPQNTANVV